MRVVVVYREDQDYSRSVIDFLHDFKKQTGHDLETMDPYSAAGTLFCDTYGIVEYPTVLALSDSSTMQSMWRGLPLPTISEVSFYV
jgi:hypothetical protein